MDEPPSKRRRSARKNESESVVPLKNQSKSSQISPSSPTKPKSLHSFFQPATEGQRWSSRKFENRRPVASVETIDADVIEDDYDSYDEIFTQHIISQKTTTSSDAKSTHGSSHSARPTSKPKTTTRHQPHSSKRFLMPPDRGSSDLPSPSPQPPAKLDRRPWPQRFAPTNLDELAVHKKKVSDVKNWLEEALSGRRSERLLVLRGPAGSGKTTTISLLSKSVGFDVIEWRNPAVSDFTAQEYTSVTTHFEEFLGRGDRFGGLDLRDTVESQISQDERPRNWRILLVEEFPTAPNRNSSSLSAFRASLQRYLAAATDQVVSGLVHPPIVMIVSETLLSSASSISDNLTVHRLLGPTLYNHPSTAIIDFNAIAATFMQKALRLILEKEAQDSHRARIPGPAVLDTISEIGDIRSAISSLEFLCLKGDKTGTWGGTIAKTKSRARMARRETSLTAMEEESLKLISQREASLGMFHAVGKIVYNKRLDPSLVPAETVVLPPPPDHLSDYHRKVSQVAVNELIDETGTDTSTFICALHENYPPSCDGSLFTDNINACIEALSDSDLLGADRRSMQGARAGIGIGSMSLNAGVDILRQDELAFQVSTRGLLFHLPYPVKRRAVAVDGRRADAHKMLYPSSLRLWKKTEEIDGLVDTWMKNMLDPTNSHVRSSQTAESGVKSWKSLQSRQATVSKSDDHPIVTMMSRHDALLTQFPYMAQIQTHRDDPDSWQLNQISKVRGSRMGEVNEDGEESDEVPTKKVRTLERRRQEEKLILSDDDIVD
ncbi:hypothetical protein N7495_001871 [Penicillium taxi]|uniref:uncharacterized protein n=1 Tax=Penicillium taxi TaxID=168475 RepID=UPI0025459692|nr:uncharacterized protein N7495_001871 [Penicillium taxi]KAJ5909189.1 hypothetical protein N7495_001871 [Penicillium taxi]